MSSYNASTVQRVLGFSGGRWDGLDLTGWLWDDTGSVRFGSDGRNTPGLRLYGIGKEPGRNGNNGARRMETLEFLGFLLDWIFDFFVYRLIILVYSYHVCFLQLSHFVVFFFFLARLVIAIRTYHGSLVIHVSL